MRRKPATGSISELTTRDGRTRYRVRLPDESRTSYGTYDTYEQAHGILEAHRARCLDENRSVGTSSKLGDYVERWLKRREEGGQVADIEREWSSYRNQLLPFEIAKMDLRQLNKPEGQHWVNLMRKQWEDETASKALRIVKQALDDAVDEGLIDRNPFKLLRIKIQPKEPVSLSESELRRLLEARDEIPLNQWQVAAGSATTGLRLGELYAIRHGDLHLEAQPPYIQVCRSWDRDVTKNGKQQATYLSPLALEVFSTIEQRQPDALIWPNPGTGKMYARRHGSRWWRTVRKKLGIRDEVLLKNLRHTAGTAWLNGWTGERVSLDIVSRQLRHSDTRITQKRYARLLEDTIADAMATQTGYREGRLKDDPKETGTPDFSKVPESLWRPQGGLNPRYRRERPGS